MVYLFQAVVLWMKLISYAHVNHDLRQLIRFQKVTNNSNSNSNSNSNGSLSTKAVASPTSNSKSSSANLRRLKKADSSGWSTNSLELLQATNSIDDNGKPSQTISLFNEVKDLQPPYLQYPHNITLLNLLYFCVAPTLCYQLNYPRSPSIRLNYVMTLVVRMLICGGLILFTVEQYIAPTLEQSFEAMKTMDIADISLRLLKLSIPNTYLWLMIFYFYFHLWLNLLAELTRFGDRLFYKDW